MHRPSYEGAKSCSSSRIPRTSFNVLPSSKYSLVIKDLWRFHTSDEYEVDDLFDTAALRLDEEDMLSLMKSFRTAEIVSKPSRLSRPPRKEHGKMVDLLDIRGRYSKRCINDNCACRQAEDQQAARCTETNPQIALVGPDLDGLSFVCLTSRDSSAGKYRDRLNRLIEQVGSCFWDSDEAGNAASTAAIQKNLRCK